jgi:ATP-dependent Clp protease adaptor protein ClpS|tara:strand:- start:7624 stop:7905 length:282 start_codon:yes stop_codon:yes gene_type:complete
MKITNSTHTQEDSDVLVEEAVSNKIVLFNDEVNSFDFVIDALIKVCGHEAIQAEQCTILVHFKGRCTVKEGDYDDLEPMCTALLDRGLTAEIQ